MSHHEKLHAASIEVQSAICKIADVELSYVGRVERGGPIVAELKQLQRDLEAIAARMDRVEADVRVRESVKE